MRISHIRRGRGSRGRQVAAHGGVGHREEEQVRDDGQGTGGQVQEGAVAQDVQPGGHQIND